MNYTDLIIAILISNIVWAVLQGVTRAAWTKFQYERHNRWWKKAEWEMRQRQAARSLK